MKKITYLLAIMLMTLTLTHVSARGSGSGNGEAIAGIVFQEDQFFRFVKLGMEETAEKAGYEFLGGNSDNKLDKEIQLINTYSTRGVSAIVVSPLSSTASIKALKTAHENGIRVITYNTKIDADFPLGHVQHDDYDYGKTVGMLAKDFINTKLKGKKTIKVATLAFDAQLPEYSRKRVNGFLDQIKNLPGVKIVSQQDAWLKEAAIAKAGDIITANPDIDIFYGANDGATIGTTLAVKNSGKQGQIFVFGVTTADNQIFDFLQSDDDILQAVAAPRPYEIGELAMEKAIKSIEGESFEKETIIPSLALKRGDDATIKKAQKEFNALLKK